MTSEVVLMNRQAVALAADSATTVTRWVKGVSKRRYFKGANKLFLLSNAQPVGLMINGAGNLQGGPWDILIKSFRDSLGRKRYGRLSEYADALFSWLENNSAAFPKEFLVDYFLAKVVESVGRIAFPIVRSLEKKR